MGTVAWSGIGFGIGMTMEIHGVDRRTGERLEAACESTIAELERAFSLYSEDSELSVLNRERVLRRPSAVFREVCAGAVELNRRTAGYFEPAVHGVWRRLEEDPRAVPDFSGASLKWLAVGDEIRLDHPRTELSFNALVQGVLADKVAAQVRAVGAVGAVSALLQLGETVAVGAHPDGRPWRLAVAGGETILGELDLSNSGMAVSRHDAGRLLVDPVSGSVLRGGRTVAVVSEEGAAVADAFATALAVAPPEARAGLAENLAAGGACQAVVWEGADAVFRA